MKIRCLSRLFLIYCITSLPTFAAQDTQNLQQDFSGQPLHLFTWTDYLNQELVTDFEQEHKVKIKFSYFETNEQRDVLIGNKELRAMI